MSEKPKPSPPNSVPPAANEVRQRGHQIAQGIADALNAKFGPRKDPSSTKFPTDSAPKPHGRELARSVAGALNKFGTKASLESTPSQTRPKSEAEIRQLLQAWDEARSQQGTEELLARIKRLKPGPKETWSQRRALALHYVNKLEEARAKRKAAQPSEWAKAPASSAQPAAEVKSRHLRPKPTWRQRFATPLLRLRKFLGHRATQVAQQAEQSNGATDRSQEIVADPVTGKRVRRYLLEASERDREAIMRPDRLKRRVF